MASIIKMISDIELRLYGGKPSDDAEIDHDQIRFWLDEVNKRLITDYIDKNGIPPEILRRIECLEVKHSDKDCGACMSKNFIELPKNKDGSTLSVLSLPDDGGIVELLKGNKPVYRLKSPSEIRIRTNMRFSGDESYFYRIADKIFLYGGIYPSYCKLDLVVATIDTTDLNEDDNFPTAGALEPMILEEVEKIGLRELNSQYDTQNDGTDN